MCYHLFSLTFFYWRYVVDIDSKAGYPACALSNFAHNAFVFDDVECASMEGLLQSFKFDKLHIQREVCKLIGIDAKYRGQKRNKAWKRVQKLWWMGVEYDRHGNEYQKLLDRAFKSLAQNASFQKAMRASHGSSLTHSMGKSKEADTVLTEYEFCSRLETIRSNL